MNESLKFAPIEQRVAKNPNSYIEINGSPTNPDAWPVQIRNGVISVDFGAGCLGCAWCITKRQPGRAEMQDIPYKNNLLASDLSGLLSETRAYTEAKLPLRIGNNTDGTLIPVDQLKEFYGFLPHDYPVALLTRGVHSAELTEFLKTTGDNFVLCRSVTPPHPSLDYKVNLDKALKSFNEANCQKILNIGPLASSTVEDARQLLQSGKIPQGTRVIIAPLNRRRIDDQVLANVYAEPISKEEMGELEAVAVEAGMVVHRANNCGIADFNRMPSMEYGDINGTVLYDREFDSKTAGTSNNRGLESICGNCSNFDVCAGAYDSRQISDDTMQQLIATLDINEAVIRHQGPGLVVIDAPGITKAETSYLSGVLGVRVSGINSLAQPDSKAAQRWIRTGFYPVEKMLSVFESFDPLRFQQA